MIRTNHFSSDHWADWIMMHRKTIAIACACLVVALIGGVWAMQSSNARKIKDFETADILADELQKTPKLFDSKGDAQSTNQALASLKALDDEYSILQPRFDSLIAQEMLLQSNDKELDPYAKRAIHRLRALGLTDFADYSEVSRLAGLQLYKEALELATSLKTKLAAENSVNQYLLQGFLLLHIATINQKLGNHEAKLQTVLELKEYLGLTKRKIPLTAEEKELASQMLAHLQDRESSLLEFIEEMPKAMGS